MKKLIEVAYRIHKHLFKQNKEDMDRILNDGERYDPSLAGWTDICHIQRYEFAKRVISKEDSVIDIACGTGYGTAMISKLCNNVVGIDASTVAIQYAREKYATKNIKFVLSDLFQVNMRADIVLSFETIEHVRVNNVGRVLNKLVSISKKKIVGSVPYKERIGNNRHHFLFNLDENNFKSLNRKGHITFFYQAANGKIYTNKSELATIQNLIFIFEK